MDEPPKPERSSTGPAVLMAAAIIASAAGVIVYQRSQNVPKPKPVNSDFDLAIDTAAAAAALEAKAAAGSAGAKAESGLGMIKSDPRIARAQKAADAAQAAEARADRAAGAPAPEVLDAATPAAAARAAEVFKKKYPASSARLMGIDALTDKDGSVSCSPPGDGWAHYFLDPAIDIPPLFKCRGDIDSGLGGQNKPVSLEKHDPLPAQFIDSNAAMISLRKNVNAMGRISMALKNHKTPPLKGHPLLWHIRVGADWHWVDGRDGAYLGKGAQ